MPLSHLLRKPAFLKAAPANAAKVASPRRERAAAVARWILAPACAALGGATMMNLSLHAFGFDPNTPQHFILAGTLLVIASRLIGSRKEGVAALAGWYAGALFALPFIWRQFFASSAGWAVWALLTVLLAVPAVLAPRGRPALGILVAILLAAVPPLGFVGIGNPLMVAGAMFPGAGWLGLGLTIAFFALSACPAKPAVLAQGAMLAWAVATVPVPVRDAPDNTWAATTHVAGKPATNLTEAFDRQDAAIAMAMGAINEGAKVIVFPEATDPEWGPGQAFYWKRVTELAKAKGAQVLLGVYTDGMEPPRTNGLVDLTTGRIYPATLSAPASLWRPWAASNPFPLRWDGSALIPTRNGPAAHLICYEELLPWPLALQHIAGRPTWLVSAANQWFDEGWMLKPQQRSVAMQARLWGLPLARAVNYAELKF